MNSFLKLAVISLIGLVVASFALGLIQDQTYNNSPYGNGDVPKPGRHMMGNFHWGGFQGTYEFNYGNGK